MVTPQQHVIANSAGLTVEQIQVLNRKHDPLNFEQRIRELYRDFDPEKVLVTSSFAATSAYFLHIISRIRPEQEITFIDTGFHFPETLVYRDYLVELFGLKVVDLKAEDWKHEFTEREETYQSDPDFCCSINKVEPLEAIKGHFHVWVSSLMRWQTEHRAGLAILEERRGILKFNPMLDVTKTERDDYIREHRLPFHPLVAEGYLSIGCRHCTRPGDERSGRWVNKPKTECGLTSEPERPTRQGSLRGAPATMHSQVAQVLAFAPYAPSEPVIGLTIAGSFRMLGGVELEAEIAREREPSRERNCF